MGTQHEARVPVCGVQIPPSPPIIWASRIVAIAAGCKPAVVRLRWFESNLAHQNVSPFNLDTAFNVMVVSSNERGLYGLQYSVLILLVIMTLLTL